MRNLHDYADEDIVNAETHHEKSDVNVRALFVFFVAFVIFCAISHFVILFMYRQFVNLEKRHQNVPLTMMERPESMTVPVVPRLQPFPTKTPTGVIPPMASTPVTDMVEMGDGQKQALNSYGYVDRQKGTVHIPIEEAKKRALQQGFAPLSVGQAPPPVPAVEAQAPPPVPAAPPAEAHP